MSSKGTATVSGKVDMQKGQTPKLRFPKFRDMGPWPVKPLRTIAERQSTKNSDHKVTRVLTNSAEYGVVDQRDYFEKDIATQGNLDGYYIVERGDYVYNPRISSMAPVGPIGKNNVGRGVMSPLYTVFRFKNGNDTFYEHYFRSTCWHDFLRRSSNSGARHDRMAISNNSFFEMPLPAPSAAEQVKIANCLSSLDELISAEVAKLAALMDHKAGMIQQLFPIDGEATPRLRFSEFDGAGGWKWKTLGSLLECPPTYGANAAAVPFNSKLPAYLRITDIAEDGSFINKGRASVNVAATPENSMQAGDIALARTGASVGKSYLHDDAQGPIVFAGFLIRIRADKDLILPTYLRQFLQSQNYWSWVSKTSMRSGQPGINSTEYASLMVPLPNAGKPIGITEQNKISECLSGIDAISTALTSKIAQLRLHRRGLRQHLFITPTEPKA